MAVNDRRKSVQIMQRQRISNTRAKHAKMIKTHELQHLASTLSITYIIIWEIVEMIEK